MITLPVEGDNGWPLPNWWLVRHGESMGNVAAARAHETEAGVYGLPQSDEGSVLGEDLSAIVDSLGRADVVVIGSGLDHPGHVRLILTPNRQEASRLAVSVGALGFLARELLAELPRVLVELST